MHSPETGSIFLSTKSPFNTWTFSRRDTSSRFPPYIPVPGRDTSATFTGSCKKHFRWLLQNKKYFTSSCKTKRLSPAPAKQKQLSSAPAKQNKNKNNHLLLQPTGSCLLINLPGDLTWNPEDHQSENRKVESLQDLFAISNLHRFAVVVDLPVLVHPEAVNVGVQDHLQGPGH